MKILVDSCCDLSGELRERTQAARAPLTITIDAEDIVDDGSSDIRSACPSPDTYAGDIQSAEDTCFVVTLSGKLSGSHNAATLGAELAKDSCPDKPVHVFDSESASAGETYLALMLRDLIDAGRSFEEIVSAVEEKIRTMHTVFVLDTLDNLVKNGRLSKAVALIAGVLSIRLLLSDDGSGDIKLLGKARGIKGALAQMVDTCKKHTEGLAAGSQRLVLSYCNCLDRANQVAAMIREKCPAIGEIIMTPTSALSSMYAGDGGIVIAY